MCFHDHGRIASFLDTKPYRKTGAYVLQAQLIQGEPLNLALKLHQPEVQPCLLYLLVGVNYAICQQEIG